MTKILLPFPISSLFRSHCNVRLTYLDYKQELTIFWNYSWYQQYTHPRTTVHEIK